MKNNERDFPKRSDAGDQKNFVLFLTCTTRGKGELAGSSPALNDLLSNKQGQLLYRCITQRKAVKLKIGNKLLHVDLK